VHVVVVRKKFEDSLAGRKCAGGYGARGVEPYRTNRLLISTLLYFALLYFTRILFLFRRLLIVSGVFSRESFRGLWVQPMVLGVVAEERKG